MSLETANVLHMLKTGNKVDVLRFGPDVRLPDR